MLAENASDLVFGLCPKPVHCGFDLTIGAGYVFPEVNFTLPAISVEESTWSQVVEQYDDMATRILDARRRIAGSGNCSGIRTASRHDSDSGVGR